MEHVMPRGASPDQPYHDRLRDVEYDPIFIMGDHRTGTTLLYRLLDAVGLFNVVTAYHIIGYDHLIDDYVRERQHQAKADLAQQFVALGIADRQIDGVTVSPDLPEEYGFLLGANYREQITPATAGRFDEICRKVQLVAGNVRPLLLKNPWDYFLRFAYVKQLYPRARFVFIQRHPLHVINSQIRAIRSSVEGHHAYLELISPWYARLQRRPLQRQAIKVLFGERAALGLRITLRHVDRATRYLEHHLPALPTDDYVAVRYEDLCAAPAATIARILDHLGMTPPPLGRVAAIIDQRPTHLLPEVERNAARIERRLQPYYERYGYGTTTFRTPLGAGGSIAP